MIQKIKEIFLNLIRAMEYNGLGDKSPNSCSDPGLEVFVDRPVFPHRGLIIDTSRNFVEILLLKRIISTVFRTTR